MATKLAFTDRELLERFREAYPELSIYQMAEIDEDEFVERYAEALKCDSWQTRRVHRVAAQIKEQVALIWINLKEAASPHLKQTLFNNIPSEFLEHLQSIPGYDRLFGSLDFIDCDHARSIFGPAAYFVDLMRFVETNITRKIPANLSAELKLEQRRPDLAKIRLDKDNTYDLIPYIDLVIEMLEAVIRTKENPDVYQIVEAAGFPMTLPFNLPLTEIRSYLSQLKTNLHDIYQTFGTAPSSVDHLDRELLDLSPKEHRLISTEITELEELADYYGGHDLKRLSNVQVFLTQTGLTRSELNDLIFQDLDRHEVNAGLSRLFFINNVDDGLGHLMIEQDPAHPHDPSYDSEHLVNLSPQKLDRIYRFLKLAGRLDWSFADLDWAIRSLHPPYRPEPSLNFDGVNEYVACPKVKKTLVKGTFTLEAWVNPVRHGLNPIIAKGDAADPQNHQTHFLFWIDAEGRLAYYDKKLLNQGQDAYLRSLSSIPTGRFSHVAVTVSSAKEVAFYINGKSAPVAGSNTLPSVPATIGTDLEIGRNLGECYFAGLIKEVRLWDTARTQAQLEATRYRRLTGRETHLVGYWPLLEDRSGRLIDYSASANHGLLGGNGFVTQPTWAQRDLVLDPMPVAMRFSGLDQYLAAVEVKGFDQERTTLTLEAWLNIIDLDRDNVIICQGSAADQKAQFLFGVNPEGELVFKSSSVDSGYKSKSKVKAQELTHVCITLSEQAVTFYINGILDKTHPLAAAAKLQPQGRDLYLGCDFDRAYFNGLIKEVRVWDVARTVEQIVQDKDHPLGPYEHEDLIGYWQLDKTDTLAVNGSHRAIAKDRSSNQNHLHLGGVLEDYMPSLVNLIDLPATTPVTTTGTVLTFDGENDVITLFDAENTGLGQFERWTLAFWFKAAVVDQPGRHQVLFIQGDTEAGLRIFIENGLKIAVWSGDYEAATLTESVIQNDKLSADRWYHLAVTNDGAAAPDSVDLKAYLDGEQIGRITMAENFTFSPIGAAYLGGLGRTPGQTRIAGKVVDKMESHHLHYFAGQVADLRFWRVVKEATDIKRERYVAPDPRAEELVVYLPLDEGHGLTFKDQSRSHDPCLPPDHEGRFYTRNVALVNIGSNGNLENAYSHYVPEGVDVLGWQNYVYTGRLRLTDAGGGIGMTIYSRYPDQQARFYQLRRTQHQPNFHFTGQPYDQQILSGLKTTSSLNPIPNTWYRFKIQVATGADETSLKANIWPDGAVEPETYDLETVDHSANRLTSGTVGLWAFGPGEKQFDDLEVTINGQPQLLPANSFEAYGSDQDPKGWHDTSVRVYHDIEADLFRTHMVEQKRVFGTDSELTNIHAHYNPQGGSVDIESWTGYEYTGRMRLTDDEGGIGVTFFSRYPQGKDQYYRLRRHSRKRNFHLASHSARIGGNENVAKMAVSTEARPNIWYRFRIRVQYNPDHTGSQSVKGATHIQANVWQDLTPEPDQFEIDVFDESDPITSGTVGVWSMAKGSKYFDDLMVTPTSTPGAAPLLEEDFEQYDHGQAPEAWLSTGQNNRRKEAPGLFSVMLHGNPVLGPGRHLPSDDENLHTHYVPAGVDVLSWQNYTYTGRMYVAGETSGIGVTFYSRYPEQRDEYYRLGRCQERPAFHLSSHPEGLHLLSGDTSNADVPTELDTWYRFYIEVKTVEDPGGAGQTRIRAKLWQDGDPQPAEFQIEAIDSSVNRLTSGAIGVWADADGPVYVDELQVWRELLLDEDFDLYNEGQTPNNWQDTGENDSTDVQTGLFKILRLENNRVFGLEDDLNDIHSHFIPAALDLQTLSDYIFTGRMRLADENGGLGLTFFSHYPGDAFYYSLRRLPGPDAPFQLIGYPQGKNVSGNRRISKIAKDAKIKPALDDWYRFHIEVSHDPNYRHGRNEREGATSIKAKIWSDGSPEPDEFDYIGLDYSSPITFGTVGLWTTGSGGKYFDDLKVSRPEFLLEENFSGYAIDQKPEGWRDTKSRSRYELDDALFKTREFDDNTPRRLTTDDYPLWLNPLAMKFDGRQQYLAVADIGGDPPATFTIEAWVRPTAKQANPILSQGHSLKRQPKFWFGLNQAGKLALNGFDETGVSYAVSGSAKIPKDRFSHVAVSIDGATVSFYLAGRPDGDPQTPAPPVTLSGPDLEIGRNLANEQFGGYIREVRLWQGVRSPEQITAGRYQSGARILTEQGHDLIAYWPFLEIEGSYTQDAADAHHLRRGGLARARQPDLVEASWQPEQGFWQPDRQVLAFKGPNDIIHWQGSATDDPRRRRTIAVWFRVEDKTVSSRKQVIYHEGDEQRGVLIYVYAGCLYFGGYSGVVWPGTWLDTDRIESGRWHQAVIVLDGRPDLRRGAFQACLDGKLVDVGHGSQLGDYPHNLTLGGIAGPVRFHDSPKPASDSSHCFRGQMMELAIWNTTFTPEEVSILREAQLSSKKVGQKRRNLVLGWHFDQVDFDQKDLPNTAGGRQAVKINPAELQINPHHSGLQPLEPVLIYRLPHTELATETLARLARIKKLLERYPLSMDRLTALWFGPKHMGREDQRTLFDQVFNAQDGADQPWSYYLESMRWNVAGQGNLVEDRAIRSRLMGALRLSDSNLSHLVSTLSGPGADLIVLDGVYLNRLYRLTNLPRTLRLSLAEFTRLKTLLGLEDVDSLAGLLLLSEHLHRLHDIGVSVPVWDFLANDMQSDQVSVQFDEAALRDFADELRSQSADFLATAETFVSDEINQFQSIQIFKVFRQRGVIDENGTVTPEYAKASGPAVLSRDPAWQADLTALAVKLKWRAEFDADLAAGPQWRIDLDQSLGELGLTSSLIEQILQKLQGHGLVAVNGLVLAQSISDADLRAAFAADRVQDPVRLPGSVSLSAIRKLLTAERVDQQAFLQTVIEKLLANGFVDANGLVLKETMAELNDNILGDLLGGDKPPGAHLLVGVRNALSRRMAIQDQLGGVLLSLRQAYDSTVLVALSTLLGADADLTQVVIEHFKAEMPPARFFNLMLKLEDGQPIPAEITAIPSPETDRPPGYLYKLSKLLFLAAQFELAATEMTALLAEPATLDVKDALRPNLDDLDSLRQYGRLRQAFKDTEGKLLGLCQSEDRFSQIVDEARGEQIIDDIAAFTGWDRRQLDTLVQHFGRAEDYNRVTGLSKLKRGFDLARSMGADIEFLIDLADTRSLDDAFYRRQADALLNVLRAQYDEERWPKIYKPIRDALAVQKRDALLSLAMLKIPTEFEGRRSPDILSEYLLIDVQAGSEVDTSRIQQAIAAVQLYVQRCRMNLERGVDPAWIPPEQWEWMKNYRVWEANRKVFLYPENYIEPDLRDTKSPLFEELEQELMQADINQAAVEIAYTHYLDKFAEIANLKIVGSYLHQPLSQETTTNGDEILYLIGRTDSQPRIYYIRKRIKNEKGERWLPWNKIDLVIDSDFVSPVYAFGRLYLFWSEFRKLRKSAEIRISPELIRAYPVDLINKAFVNPYADFPIDALHRYAVNGDVKKYIETLHQWFKQFNRQNQARIAVSPELTVNQIKRFEKGEILLDGEGYLISRKTELRFIEDFDVYDIAVKYSYYNFSKAWAPPQTYLEEKELRENPLFDTTRLRVYPQRKLYFSQGTPVPPVPTPESGTKVLEVNNKGGIPNLRVADGNMDRLTCSCWANFALNPGKKNALKQAELAARVSLFNYGNGDLSVEASNFVAEIPGAIAAKEMTKKKLNQAKAAKTEADKARSNAVFVKAQAVVDAARVGKDAVRDSTVRGDLDVKLKAAQKNVDEAEQEAIQATLDAQTAANQAVAVALKAHETAGSPRTETALAATRAAAQQAAEAKDAQEAVTAAQEAVTAARATQKGMSSEDRAKVKKDLDAVQAAVTAAQGKVDEFVRKAKQAAADAEAAAQAAYDHEAPQPNFESKGVRLSVRMRTRTQRDAAQEAARRAAEAANELDPGRTFKAAQDAIDAARSVLRDPSHPDFEPSIALLTEAQALLTKAQAEQDIRKAVVAAKSAADVVREDRFEPPASQEFTLNQYGWHHLAITLEYQPSLDPNHRPGYVGTLYDAFPLRDAGGAAIKDPDTQKTRFTSSPPQALMLAGVDVLPSRRAISVGALGSKIAFTAHMSEFQLWNLDRGQEVIYSEQDERKRPNEFGLLLNLPLNADPPNQRWVDATAANLPFVFRIVPAPEVPILERERLVMFYGDQIKTLRNTIEDQNFTVRLNRNLGNQPTYDVDLALSKLYVATTKGLSINDYATGRHSTLGQQYSAIESYRNADPDATLLTKLPQTETTLMDVNNQPGWYTLDTGDEQFLLKADIADLLTTEKRLTLPPAVATEPHETQAINIHFNSDSSLQVGSAPPRFKVERLSTYAIHDLSKNLFTGGIDGLLNLDSQKTGEFPFSIYEPNVYDPKTAPNGLVIPDGITPHLDFTGAYGPYYWEVFFHIPFLIANQLNANQNFEDAQKWYHYIFNPTTRETTNSGNEKDRYWRFLPFRTFSKEETLADIISDTAALAEYREDPFDPHAIARLRIFAYQKAVVMKYIDNLLDWGDSLFSQDTRESINEAAALYVLAYNLLGAKPKAKTVKTLKEIGDYAAIRATLGKEDTPDFVVELDRQTGSSNRTGQAAVTPNSNLITSFCVPENEKFIGYWDRVEDRLYKIRHSLNIEGVFRQLALFEPPIDPAALVRAVAGGRGIGGALSDLNVPVPHYRYSFMLENAKEMAAGVIGLGAALLSAIESRDAEKLAILQNTHERNILSLMTNIKQAERSVAQETLEALQISKENIDNRKKRYDDLVAKNLSAEEVRAGIMRAVAWGLKNGATTFKALEGVLGSLPEIESGASGFGGSPVATVKIHSRSYTAWITAALEIALLIGEGLYAIADATEKSNEYKRRLGGWKFEQKTAEFDQREIEKQIGIAQIQIQMAERELSIHDKTIQQNREIEDFYRSKFSNQALYNWMVARLSGLYFQAYRLAYDMAKSAEKALQYELPTTDSLISFGHWDSLKKGLLAGESLLLEVNRMEKYHLDNDSRFLEIEKTISMRQEMPGSLLSLVAGGGCEFQLTEEMFNRDYPGHYFRVIKTMAISVKVAVGPYQSVKATLVQVGSKALLEPSIDAVRYLMGDEGAEQPDGNVVRTNWRANQQIAISKANEDYGMFVLNFFLDDRYFPFEGTGAVSTWRLEMPHETNPDIDFTQIEDAIIHLRYTAKSDSGKFKEDVKDLIEAMKK